MNETGPSRIISIAEYEKTVESTDTLIPDSQIESILLGLFGEVGSVMSTAKKLHREKGAFEAGYREDTEEEFGDVLWYVTALCRRCRIGLADLISEVLAEGDYTVSLAANSGPRCPNARVIGVPEPGRIDPVLLEMGDRAGAALRIVSDASEARTLLKTFLRTYVEALQVARVSFAAVLARNTAKIRRLYTLVPKSIP